MVEEWIYAKTTEDCEEMATVDCYNDDECLSGWLTCLEEVFEDINKVKLLEEDMNFKGFDFSGRNIITVCQRGRDKIKVTLDSVEFLNLTKVQRLWLEAWLKWQ